MLTPDHQALRADHRALTRRGVPEEHATQLLRVVAEFPRTYIRPADGLDRHAWARLLAALVQGRTLADAAAAAGVSRPWLKMLRRRDRVGGVRLRGVARLECPGRHCVTTTGYDYGCGRPRCRQAKGRAVVGARQRSP
jgi:hypothetical protein